jgi:hypothetical protein
MQQLNLKPTHKLVKNYYEALGQFGQLSIDHEMAVRSAFQSLLAGCGRQFDWTLVPEYTIKKPPASLIKVDGALVDTFRLTHGFWEAKDEHDELPRIPFVGRAGLQASVSAGPTSSGAGLQPGGTASSDRAVLGSPGLQAGEKNGALGAPSSLPKADAQSQAERQNQVPQGLEPLRDDAGKNGSERGPEGPLHPSVEGRSSEAPLYQTDREVFHAFAEAGRRLAHLHVNYESQPEYPLEHIENPKEQLNWRVEKMRLSKDKTTLVYNEFLTLKGIPPETYEYRLGNRSALEWVVDQYQVSTDKRSQIVNDPNRADDPEYIVRLIGQVITVSLETMKIVNTLPPLLVNSGA